MGHIVITSFYEGNTLHEEGSEFTHENADYVQKLLADGNIAGSDDELAQAKAAAAAKVAEVEAANVADHEARAAAAVEAAAAANAAPEAPATETPLVEDGSVSPGTLTPEQVEQDFKQAGAVSPEQEV